MAQVGMPIQVMAGLDADNITGPYPGFVAGVSAGVVTSIVFYGSGSQDEGNTGWWYINSPTHDETQTTWNSYAYVTLTGTVSVTSGE